MPNAKSTTPEDHLQKQRDELDKLRQEIADVQSGRLEAEQEASNEIVAAQLAAEKERLLATLAQAKQQAKLATAKPKEGSGVVNPLEQAKAQMANAEAARKAVEDANKQNQES